MRKIIISLMLIITIIFGASCSGTKKDQNQFRFSPENAFHIKLNSNEIQTELTFFFDERDTLHLLHDNSDSPLYGLEEIFTEEGVKSRYQELEFNSLPYSGGVATVFYALNTIQKTDPIQTRTEKNTLINHFLTKRGEFDFITSSEQEPIQIKGEKDSLSFVIEFLGEA